MGLFKFKKTANNLKKFTVYIAEDNTIYLKQLEFFLNKTFGEKIDVHSFPVSEVIEVKLEHGKIPDAIIMDHHLSAKYDDANTGINALKSINRSHPKILLILHSAQNEAERSPTSMDSSYVSVPKGTGALNEIERLIAKRLN